MKLENELAAQLWRVFWDDVEISNLRACSPLTASLVILDFGYQFWFWFLKPAVLASYCQAK